MKIRLKKIKNEREKKKIKLNYSILKQIKINFLHLLKKIFFFDTKNINLFMLFLITVVTTFFNLSFISTNFHLVKKFLF
jgi:hypothetical protein